MSSTLSEGVRVPDIGSVNWGADVNFNWGLLNTALANISGNVKTDVANTWTATQTFTETISGSITRAVGDEDGNNIKAALAGKQSALTAAQLDACNSGITAAAVQQIGTNTGDIATKAADNAVVHLAGAETIPGDKTFSGINDFKTLRLYGTASNNLVAYTPSGVKGDSSTFGLNVICSDQNLGSYAASGVANIGMGQSGGTSYVALNASTIGSTDHNTHSIQIGLQIAASDNANIGSFYPSQNNGISLGTSTNKWKTLNGINPGALSLPNLAGAVDIASSITNTAGGDNYYTAPADGLVSVVISGTSNLIVFSPSGKRFYYGSQSMTPDNEGNTWCSIPVPAGYRVRIRVNGSIIGAAFYPCQGNV